MATMQQIRDAIDAELPALWTAIQNRQAAYFAARGRYWQGIKTPAQDPVDDAAVAPNLALKPTDQAEDWAAFGISLPATIKASLEIHAHNGPLGQGYTAFLRVFLTERNRTWIRARHHGAYGMTFGWTEITNGTN